MNIKKLFILSILSMCLSSFSFAQTVVVSDPTINSNVKSKISADSSLSGASIDVATSKGVVSLSGNVDTDTQATKATELAESTEGVQDVDTSNLTVKGSQHPLTDAYITSKVKGMFIQQKLFGDKDVAAMTIKVETQDGVVSLSGNADNQDQIDNAIKIAKAVVGVKDVKSSVNISNS